MFAHFDDLMRLYVHLYVWVFRAWGRREGSKPLEVNKARKLRGFQHLVLKKICVKSLFQALALPWKRQQARNLRALRTSVKGLLP